MAFFRPRTERPCSRPLASAFTLVELMVSIAIAVIVILGIAQVFSIGSKTIGTGQSISTMNRDDRAAHAVFSTDLGNVNIGSDCPAFMIRSHQIYAFASATDKNGASNPNDPSNDPTFQGINSANGGTIPVNYYNYRNHRLDCLAFFARNFYSRLTGGDDNGNNQFISPTTSNEAYIWYGHLGLPSNLWLAGNGVGSGNWYEPGTPGVNPAGNPPDTNDNNLYASDWILGRVAILLVHPPATNDTSYIENRNGGNGGLDPLAIWPENSASKSEDGSQYLWQSRYDQANTSIAAYGQTLSAFTGTGTDYSTWNSNKNNWFEYLIGGPPTSVQGSPSISGRFQANPFPVKYTSASPGAGGQLGLSNGSLARTFPIFLRGCSQFIVEYAGNYYTKTSTTDPTPLVTNGASPPDPSGQLDFVMVNGIKQIRWYGFPRHTSGITATTIYPTVTNPDVMPLGIFLQANGVTVLPQFERYYPGPAVWGISNYTPSTDLVNTLATAAGYVNGVSTHAPEYVAAWGPDTASDVSSPLPKMIRITLALDDPQGNVTTPQWFEYVINLNP